MHRLGCSVVELTRASRSRCRRARRRGCRQWRARRRSRSVPASSPGCERLGVPGAGHAHGRLAVLHQGQAIVIVDAVEVGREAALLRSESTKNFLIASTVSGLSHDSLPEIMAARRSLPTLLFITMLNM